MRTFLSSFLASFLASFFLGFSIFVFFPGCSYAQDESFLPETEASDTLDKDGGSPYALATDEQIKEAQRFYNSCTDNATLSKQKDCKCAAAAYLETRVRLGDAASVNEIMDENINTCLLDEKAGKIEDVERLDLENVTQQQLDEAEEVYNWCMDNPENKRVIDCECLAAEFLDLRMKRGPIESQNVLVLEITQHGCRNIVETTGLEYGRCMGGMGFDYHGIRPKDYCECYARIWGKLFKDYAGQMDEYKKSSIRFKARRACLNPDTYRKK